jgi:nicotinamidase-related amidase
MKQKKWFLRVFLIGAILILYGTNQPIFAEDPPKKQALIIVDVQEFYFPGGFQPLVEPEEAAKQIARVLAVFREQNWPVIHVKHQVDAQGDIHRLLTPLPGEAVVTKTRANSFYETPLLDLLSEQKTTDLVVVGMQTHMCVEATARAASDFGFQVTVLSDACATRDLVWKGEQIPALHVHQSTLATLKGSYAKILDVASFLETAIFE